MRDEGWTFEATRECTTCRGSGKFQPSAVMPPGLWKSDIRFLDPAACQACHGAKVERRTFTIAELRTLLLP
jgi:DnaJ-class molecular chaperone